jgi:hypothetical protein
VSAWVKVHNSMPSHPKALMAGDRACWLAICGLCFSNEHLTDGFIAEHVFPAAAPGVKNPEHLAAKLVAAGIWHRVEGGWEIHDYDAVQRSSSEIRERREKDAGRKAAGRSPVSAKSPRGQVADSTPDSTPDSARSPSGVQVVEGEGEGEGEQIPPTEVARRRARRPVDQTKRPDGFPDSLVAAGRECLTILHRTWELRGGREPQARGVGLSMLRNEKADHVAVARSLEHWLTAGNGQRARCDDVARRFGDWVADAGAAQRDGQVIPFGGRKENASDWLQEDFVDGEPIVDAQPVEDEGDVA